MRYKLFFVRPVVSDRGLILETAKNVVWNVTIYKYGRRESSCLIANTIPR
jgi:hypothetical protein